MFSFFLRLFFLSNWVYQMCASIPMAVPQRQIRFHARAPERRLIAANGVLRVFLMEFAWLSMIHLSTPALVQRGDGASGIASKAA